MPVISTNTAANTAILNLNKNSAAQETYLQQLSSGSRINTSSDDAAGLAVSGQLQSDITTLEQSSRNAQQAEALLQTADGALSRQSDILQRMKSLATQYNSGTVDDDSREFINAEYEELLTELELITSSTEFNGKNLIDGSFSESFIVGIQADDAIAVDLTSVSMTAESLGLNASLSESTQANLLTLTLTDINGDNATSSTVLGDLTTGLTGAESDSTISFVVDGVLAAGSVDAFDTTTVGELVASINSLVDDTTGEQVFDATFSNGQLSINLIDSATFFDDSATDGIDIGTTGTAGTLTLSGAGPDADGDGEGDAVSLNGAATEIIADDESDHLLDDLSTIDAAIKAVSEARSQVGAYTSAMEYQGENIDTQIENLTAARSSIVDVDIAEAQSNFTNAQVLTEAATAALAQANQLKTSLLTLLR